MPRKSPVGAQSLPQVPTGGSGGGLHDAEIGKDLPSAPPPSTRGRTVNVAELERERAMHARIAAAASSIRCWKCWHAPCRCPEGEGINVKPAAVVEPPTNAEPTKAPSRARRKPATLMDVMRPAVVIDAPVPPAPAPSRARIARAR